MFSSRESSVREFENSLSVNLREEANAVRRLEQQVESIRQDLARLNSSGRTSAATGGVCCRCATPLDVHDQFSHEVRRHLLSQQQRRHLLQDNPQQQQVWEDASWRNTSRKRLENGDGQTTVRKRRGKSESRAGILKNASTGGIKSTFHNLETLLL